MAVDSPQDVCANGCGRDKATNGSSWKYHTAMGTQTRTSNEQQEKAVKITSKFSLVERNIYGSSRIGMDRTCTEMIGSTASTQIYKHTIGLKQYELTNHLGNVLAVVTDRKHPRDDDGNGFIDYYQPEIVKATDYSPFGVELYDRNFVREEVTVISTEEQITIIDQDDFTLISNGGTYIVGDQGDGWNHLLGSGNVTANEDYFINSQGFLFGNWIIAQKIGAIY